MANWWQRLQAEALFQSPDEPHQVLKTDKKLTPQQLAELRASWEERTKGARRLH